MVFTTMEHPDDEDFTDIEKTIKEESRLWLLQNPATIEVTMSVKDLDTGEVYGHAGARRGEYAH